MEYKQRNGGGGADDSKPVNASSSSSMQASTCLLFTSLLTASINWRRQSIVSTNDTVISQTTVGDVQTRSAERHACVARRDLGHTGTITETHAGISSCPLEVWGGRVVDTSDVSCIMTYNAATTASVLTTVFQGKPDVASPLGFLPSGT